MTEEKQKLLDKLVVEIAQMSDEEFTKGIERLNKVFKRGRVEMPVMPCHFVKIISQDMNGNEGQYYLVEDHNETHFGILILHPSRYKIKRKPALLLKSNCQIILSKA